MDKYDGCNIVECVVKSEAPRRIVRRSRRGTVLRMALAAAAVCLIAAAVYAPLPFLSPVRDTLRRVMCYDVFGRSDFGSSVFARLFGA